MEDTASGDHTNLTGGRCDGAWSKHNITLQHNITLINNQSAAEQQEETEGVHLTWTVQLHVIPVLLRIKLMWNHCFVWLGQSFCDFSPSSEMNACNDEPSNYWKTCAWSEIKHFGRVIQLHVGNGGSRQGLTSRCLQEPAPTAVSNSLTGSDSAPLHSWS